MVKAEFSQRLNNVVRSIKGLEKETQVLLIAATVEAWVNNNYNWHKQILDKLHHVNGSFNFKGLVEYMTNHCGVSVQFQKDTKTYKVVKNHSFKLNTPEGLKFISNNPWYLVMKKDNPLDLPNPEAVYGQLAKLLAVGEWSKADLDKFIANLGQNVHNKSKDDNVVHWAEKYKQQHKDAA